MSEPFSWRDKSQSSAADYEVVTIRLPASVSCVELAFDQWAPLSGVGRVTNEDKVFILGFCAALKLSDSQKLALLEQYAQRYQHALNRAGSNPAKHGMAKRAANQWLGAGASGFVIRD